MVPSSIPNPFVSVLLKKVSAFIPCDTYSHVQMFITAQSVCSPEYRIRFSKLVYVSQYGLTVLRNACVDHVAQQGLLAGVTLKLQSTS